MPLAGPSPNCWAVFVQIEHCDQPLTEKPRNKQRVATYGILILMIAEFGAKLRNYGQGKPIIVWVM